MIWIKICATTNLEDALMSVAAGADALGFILAPSTRRVTPEQVAGIVTELPAQVEKIGVVVNEAPAQVAELAERARLTGVQLHGDEPPEQLADFRRALGSRKIIKTLQARDLQDGKGRLDDYLREAGSIDAILLDSGTPDNRGGTGIPFDWGAVQPMAARIRERLPLIVAGGLRPDNVAEAVRFFEPWGVDVVSGVERQTGKKDESKIRAFINAVRPEPVHRER